MRKIVLFILLLVSQVSFGQTPVLQALVSKEQVELGGNLTISFRFNESGDNFRAPTNLTQNFRVLSGPSKNTQMSWVNGAVSSTVSYSYVISPLNIGTFTIGPASIENDDNIYESQEVKIKVVSQQGKTANQQQPKTDKQHNDQQKAKAKDNLFLKLVLNKSSVYVGEQVIATYKLYNRARLNGIEAQRMPEFDGFYTSNIEVSNNNNHTRESVNGVIYDVYVLKKTILIPQKSGELTLIPLEVDANVQIQGAKPVNTWFGPQYQYKNVSISLKSNSIKLDVKPLPKNAPKSFTGAVGNFKFTTSATPNQLKVNDALTYSVKISGTGNLPLIDNPVPIWPQEFEVYDPKLKSNFNNKTNSISGSKTWEYLAIPRNGGDYEIKPLEFTFFDLTSKKYKTITSESYAIVVSGVSDGGNGNSPLGVNRQDVARLSTDIRFIHTREPNLKTVEKNFFGTVWYYFWLILPVFLTGLAYFLMRKQSELQADTIGLKKRKATKFAKKQLKQAEASLKAKDKMAFYDAVFKGLNGYIGDKLVISKADLNKSYISKKLSEANVSEQTINDLLATLDHCEMARFAPITSISDEQLLKQAQNVIVKLEDEIR